MVRFAKKSALVRMLAMLVGLGVLLNGCVAIPAGREISKKEQLSRKKESEEKVNRRTDLSVEKRHGNQLMIYLNEYGELEECYRLKWRENGHKKMVILGLFPGVGSYWYVGEPATKHGCWKMDHGSFVADIILIPIGVPAVNVMAMGMPTFFPWFSEFGADWSPPFDRGTDLSLIGWAKSGKDYKREYCTRETESKEYTDGLSDKPIVASTKQPRFKFSKETDYAGKCGFNYSEWPIVQKKDVDAEFSVPSVSPKPDPIQLTLPGDIVGSRLADAPPSKWDTIYWYGEKIDFTAGKPQFPPRPESSVRILGKTQNSPGSYTLEATLENRGRGTLYKAYALTESDVEAFNNKLIIFGKLKPGESVSRQIEFEVPKDLVSGKYDVGLDFHEVNRNEPAPMEFAMDIEGLPRPALSLAYEVIDDPSASEKAVGNGDGVIQKGEAFDLILQIKNTGQATAKDVKISFALPDDPSLQLYTPSTKKLGKIDAGEFKTARFNVAVREWSNLKQVGANVEVVEKSFNVGVEQMLKFPFDVKVAKKPVQVDADYYAKMNDTVLYGGASDNAAEIGRVGQGVQLQAVAELPDWVQIRLDSESGDLGDEQKAWVRRSALTANAPAEQPKGTARPVVITRFENQAPRITVIEPEDDVTTQDKVRLMVSIVDVDGKLKEVKLAAGRNEDGLRGMRVEGVDTPGNNAPERGDERLIKKLLDLQYGTNIVSVTAHDDHDNTSRKTLKLVRKRKTGEIYLLAVGINTYPGDYELECASDDANLFKAFITEKLDVPEENIHLLTDKAATRRNVMGAFGDLRRAVKPEDTVIVFLAGHGVIENIGGTEAKYFVPASADWDDLFATAIDMEEFQRMLNMRSKRVLVVADVCHSGSIKMRGTSSLFDKLVGEGRILLGHRGPAREDQTLGHGYLTYYLVEALKGKGDSNKDGRITIREAYEYADEQIDRNSEGNLWIKGEGDMELVRDFENDE